MSTSKLCIEVFFSPAFGMARYRDPVFRPFVHQSVNIRVNPNFDPNVQVHFPKNYKGYSDNTWYKLALRDDNSDISIHV